MYICVCTHVCIYILFFPLSSVWLLKNLMFYFPLKEELVTYSPLAKSSLPLISVNKLLLEQGLVHLFKYHLTAAFVL